MTKTMLIGLDGATYTVLQPLLDGSCEEGVVMPYLASLIEGGYSGTLKSTNHPLTPPAWTTVCTGVTPGAHGVYDFVRFEDMGHDVYFTLYDARDMRVETFWETVSRHDKSVVSLNFPMMAPPPEVNGSLVPGFVSWKHLRRNMHPKSLFARIDKIDGFDPKELSWDFERESLIGEIMEDQDLYDWVENHLPRDRQWTNIAKHLLAEDSPDVFALMLDGVDKIQHQAWHFLDPKIWTKERAASASDIAKGVRRLVLQYFAEVDEYLRTLIETAGPDTRTIIVSDHGFTGAYKVVRINTYLGELGHLTWKEDDGSEAAKRRQMANFAYLDWDNTQAFCPTPSSNGIVIRQQSEKCPNGVPPSEYEAFREQLIADLLKLEDPQTGEKVIQAVLKREDAFPGVAMDQSPDLTLILSDHGFVSVRNRAPSVVERPVPMGTHHPDGIFIMHGPGVAQVSDKTLQIQDTTAIMAHSMGLDIPRNYEGKVPADLYTAAHIATHPITKGRPSVSRDTFGHGDDMDDTQKAEMLAQLKALGYLED
ncbi:MAG: alkaline phosphatase family protein [Pseudomonadota bacterium]